jgi:hypothetical protein
MMAKQVISLCPACSACPAVTVYEEEVHIGEEGNLVKLSKEEWNLLVTSILRGELSELK